MASVLMSYITSTFQTKSDMRVAEEEWQKIIQEMSSRFKSAGALRQTVSQVWNKEGVFMLGNMWEYKDEKAFIACQSLFREAEKKLDERTSIVVKNFATRGIILHDVFFLKITLATHKTVTKDNSNGYQLFHLFCVTAYI